MFHISAVFWVMIRCKTYYFLNSTFLEKKKQFRRHDIEGNLVDICTQLTNHYLRKTDSEQSLVNQVLYCRNFKNVYQNIHLMRIKNNYYVTSNFFYDKHQIISFIQYTNWIRIALKMSG